ncbi:AAA family ATPase [Candidatus Peregrinibacteria bacterium]|nr:AAA family ATPase [Candidatus Peregrinibacteria bacterium]
MKNAKKFALLIGLQGSGKTSFAEKILVPKGYKFINGDKFLQKKETDLPYEKIKKIANEVISSNFTGLLLEFNNSNSSVRKKLINIGSQMGMETEYFIMSTSIQISLKQNRQRKDNQNIPEEIIKKRHKLLTETPPDFSEGVKKIFKISKNSYNNYLIIDVA